MKKILMILSFVMLSACGGGGSEERQAISPLLPPTGGTPSVSDEEVLKFNEGKFGEARLG